MAYSTIPKGSLHMNPVLYTGNGSTQSITGVNFQPDWTWIKKRNGTTSHVLTDIVRGITKQIYSNDTQAENTNSDTITAIGSDGFTLGNRADVNNNSDTYVAWNWKANGAGSANTDGYIASTVSVNTTSGFSIVSYTGNGSANTVGHGLGSAPGLIIVKNLTTSGRQWQILHHKNTAAPATQQLEFGTDGTATVTSQWNSVMPTASVFTIGTNDSTNKNGDSFIAYCFAEKQGYSKFGIYTGNANANGPFVYTGFKPSFVIIKRTNLANDWLTQDNKRYPINETVAKTLKPNSALAEGDTGNLDILSNGFKLRSTGTNTNASGGTYIYMAFAENPFVATSGTSAIPVTAR